MRTKAQLGPTGPKKGPPAVTYEVAAPVLELQDEQHHLSHEMDGLKGTSGPGSQANPAELEEPIYELYSDR